VPHPYLGVLGGGLRVTVEDGLGGEFYRVPPPLRQLEQPDP